MSPTLESLLAHPPLIAVVPLLYVAWADGALHPEQLARASQGYSGTLNADASKALATWLDPASPPSSTELLRLYRFVRARAGLMDAKTRAGLIDLGLSIARAEGSLDKSDATNLALAELEDALGIQGSETARYFFADRPASPQTFNELPPRFDVAALRTVLDGEWSDDWNRVRAWMARPDFALQDGLSTKDHRKLVRQWLELLAAEGIGLLPVPESYGGFGRRDRFVKTFEALAMHDLSLVVKLGVQFGLFGGALLSLGTEAHHERLANQVGRAELWGGFAMTELGHGSNVRELQTIARYEPDEDAFILHSPSVTARKEWIGNAACDGQAMVVFAQLETLGDSHGVHAFFVPVRDGEGRLRPGIHIEDCGHKMGLNGVDNGRIWFDNVRVPRQELLGRFASVAADGTYDSPIASPSRRFFTMLGTLVSGRVSVAAAAVTTSKVALTIAVRYGALRRQFGPEGAPETTILDYPAHQERLMPTVAATFAFHFAVNDLQRRWEEHRGDDTRDIEALAAGIKSLSTWHAIDTAQAARECCGGMGFLTSNRIAQIRRDVDVFATFEGDNTVLLQLVAKSVLTGFSKQLSDQLLGTLLSEIGIRARRSLFERNPVEVRRVDRDHLAGVEFHKQAFATRTHDLLISAARRLKARTADGMDAMSAATEIQNHMIALARAHIEEHVHSIFAEAVGACEGKQEAQALERMRTLYAVDRIYADIGWFLEVGQIESRKARALRKLRIELCSDARKDAVALVNSFGIPNEVLGPIAFENYAEQSYLARQS
tara:strand:- start:3254 stop:5584 length:2331 start_codon:yes stop_codon:yes gene_type:complete